MLYQRDVRSLYASVRREHPDPVPRLRRQRFREGVMPHRPSPRAVMKRHPGADQSPSHGVTVEAGPGRDLGDGEAGAVQLAELITVSCPERPAAPVEPQPLSVSADGCRAQTEFGSDPSYGDAVRPEFSQDR